jgi:hypothetical protein
MSLIELSLFNNILMQFSGAKNIEVDQNDERPLPKIISQSKCHISGSCLLWTGRRHSRFEL